VALPASLDSSLAWSAFKNGRAGPFYVASASFPSAFDTQQLLANQSLTVGNASTAEARAQSFTPSGSISLAGINLGVAKSGSPTDNVYVEIHADSSSLPSGTVLGTSDVIAGASVQTEAVGSIQTFTFSSPVSLSASTRYWFVLRRSGSVDASNYFLIRNYNGADAPYASHGLSTLNTGVWSAESTVNDLQFQLITAFYTGSALFGIFFDATNNMLEAWGSTNSGDSWTEIGSYGHPAATDAGSTYETYDVVQDGSILHVAYLNASEQVVVRQFDMSTGRWGAVTGGTPSAVDLTANVDVHVTGTAALMLARRSDGDYIVLRQGDADAIMGTSYRRVVYSRYEAGSWTNEVAVIPGADQSHFDLRAIAIDASDRTYFIFTNSVAGLSSSVLTSANSLSSNQTIDSTIQAGNYTAGHAAWVDDSTDRIVVPYIDSGGDTRLAYANVADTPTWSTTAITSTNDAEYTNSNAGSIAVNGTTIHVLWPDDSTQDLWTDSCVAGTWTFGTDTELLDAVTINGISANYLSGIGSGGVGYFYFDGSTVKYNGPAGVVGATGTVSAGSLSVNGQSIPATYNVTGSMSTGSLAVSGQSIAGTITVPATGTVSSGSHAVTGQSISSTTGVDGDVNAGSLAVSGQSITAQTGVDGDIDAGSLAVSGQSIPATIGDTGAITNGSMAISGQSISGTSDATGAMSTGSHVVAGQSISSDPAVSGAIASGSMVISGQGIASTTGVDGDVNAGSLAISGQSISATTGVVADIVAGVLAILGQSISGTISVTGDMTSGSFVISGQSISADPAVTGSIASGSLVISDQSITGTGGAGAGDTGSVSTGSHAISGQSISGIVSVDGVFVSGVLVISGQSIASTTGVTGIVNAGELLVAGQSLSASTGTTGVIVSVELTVSGQTISGIVEVTGVISSGSYVISGQSIDASAGTSATISSEEYEVQGQSIVSASAADSIILTGTLAVTGQSISGVISVAGIMTSGSLVVDDQDINGLVSVDSVIASGSHVVAGQSISSSYGITGNISSGTLTVEGNAIIGQDTGGEPVTGSVSSGSLVVSGQSISGVWGHESSVSTGTLEIGEQTISAETGVTGNINSSTIVISGQVLSGATGISAQINGGTLSIDDQTFLGGSGTGASIGTGQFVVEGGSIEAYGDVVGVIDAGILSIIDQLINAIDGSIAPAYILYAVARALHFLAVDRDLSIQSVERVIDTVAAERDLTIQANDRVLTLAGVP